MSGRGRREGPGAGRRGHGRGRRDGRGRRGRGRGRRGPRADGISLTPRGAAQLVAAAALLAAGALGGWEAPATGGCALAAAALVGLAEVLVARAARAGEDRPARLLPGPERDEERWVRLDQRGRVVSRAGGPTDGRGLYRLRSVTLSWRDAFGFWRARRTLPSDLEVCVAPSAGAAQARRAAAALARRASRRTQELGAASVRPYERGDALRQVCWRQSAHHGELMSFEREAAGPPPALVVVDALGAADADALAETASALLAALRDCPDVLVTDGVSIWRTPARQERLLAALLAEPPAAPPEAAARARTVRRLAAAGGRPREVLLVTCDARAGLGPDLLRGAGGRPPTVIAARGGDGPTRPRELVADAPADTGRDPAPAARARRKSGGPGHELLAGALCCALALLVMVPLVDVIHADPWWEAVVAALVATGAAAGSATGSLLRARGARGGVRALAAVALGVAVLAAGTACVLARHAERDPSPGGDVAAAQGPVAAAASVAADAAGRLADVVATGTAQLGGAPWEGDEARWDLAVTLAGAGLGACAALLASSRRLRCATALLPLGVAAADQAVMGTELPAWCALVCALALLLVRLSGPRARGAGRALAVALLAAALGAGASAAVAALGVRPAEGPAGTGGERDRGAAGASVRVQTLVDLSQDLRSRSDAVALTYVTTAGRPLYLRLGILNDFTGNAWEFSELGSAAIDASAPLEASAAAPLEMTRSLPVVTTTLLGAGASAPVPPGTASVEASGADLVARGRYFEPVASETDLARLSSLLANLRAAGFAATSDASAPTELERARPAELPDSAGAVVAAARADGVGASGAAGSDGLDERGQLAVIDWLVTYFTGGDFSYSLSAPGGNGQDNLSAVGEFLETRSGYCTHYATAFALLARELGVPSRVALGYRPSAATDDAGAYVVTMRQLHAWCEVWVDGAGWVGVDVTPDAAGGAGDGTDLGGAVVQSGEPETLADEAPATDPGVTTTEEVEAPVTPEAPDADPAAPNDPSAPPGEKNADAAGSPATSGGAPVWFAPAFAGAAAALVATATAVLPRARRHRRLARGDTELAWRELCRIARHRGLSWEPSATEDQVADLIAAALPDGQLAASVHRVARAACLARYGAAGSTPTAGKPADLGALLADVSRALARKGRPGGTEPPGRPERTG